MVVHARDSPPFIFGLPLHAAVRLGAFDRGRGHLRELHEHRLVEVGKVAGVLVERLDQSEVAAVKDHIYADQHRRWMQPAERELTNESVCAWLSTGSKSISTNRGRSNSCCTSLA